MYKNYDIILCGTSIGTSPNLERYFANDNIANFQNEEAKIIMSDLRNITDAEILKQKYKRLYEIYTNENAYISLYHSYEITAYSKNLAGNISANWYNMFNSISNWIKK
jgi:ABC-type transport system substrate-binding protein